jgi:8-oxo-dGTP pyrophosphatase MutT (NUDIX family)
MDFNEAKERLRLAPQLPGEAAHDDMGMSGRKRTSEALRDIKDFRESAVLALLYPKNDQAHIVLIQRPEYDGVHSKQIAFPGGKREPSDNSLVETALRETEEEVGLERSEPDIVTKLSPVYIPPSNFLVTPYLGTVEYTPTFIPQPTEVAKIGEYPIENLLDLSSRKSVTVDAGRQAIKIKTKAFVFGNHIIWGATALMLNELRILLTRK